MLRRVQDTVRRLDSLPQHSGGLSLACHNDVVERFSRFRYDYFEPALRTRNFDFLQSRVETIDTASATVAASSLYSLDLRTRDDGDIARVALSVIPVSQRETVAVAAYVADDHPLVEPEVGQFFDGPKESLPLRLSRLMQPKGLPPRSLTSQKRTRELGLEQIRQFSTARRRADIARYRIWAFPSGSVDIGLQFGATSVP